ncbi:MAG: hypothetical protein ACR2G2_09945 [Pseudonocardia sp.]
MDRAMRRENIPVSPVEQSLLELLTQPDTQERHALAELAGDIGWSRAAVAHAVLALGMETVRCKVRANGYAALAASYEVDEHAQRRAEAHSRRERAHGRWSSE